MTSLISIHLLRLINWRARCIEYVPYLIFQPVTCKKARICMEFFLTGPSLCGRRLKGKEKGVLGAREMRGACEEGGRETCQEAIVFAIPPTNYVKLCRKNATVMQLFLVLFLVLFFFCFPKTRNLK